jgi:ABC-type sugar transport system permease subunit
MAIPAKQKYSKPEYYETVTSVWLLFYFMKFSCINFIGVSQSFGLINVLTQGGPGRSTTILSYYIYQNGFQFYRFGYAAALTWVMFLVILALTLFLWMVQWRRSIAH